MNGKKATDSLELNQMIINVVAIFISKKVTADSNASTLINHITNKYCHKFP